LGEIVFLSADGKDQDQKYFFRRYTQMIADKRFVILSSITYLLFSEPRHGGTAGKGQDQKRFFRRCTQIFADG
jgi:hypothetical protein